MFEKPKSKKSRRDNKSLLNSLKGQPCVICGHTPSDPCHIKSFGSGGLSGPRDVIPMCREHHSMQHQIGFYQMSKRFPVLNTVLQIRGWEFVEVLGMKKLRKID